MANKTVQFLWDASHRFRERIQLDKIANQLKSDKLEDRCDSVIFSVYHLLVSGAIAEENIAAYLTGAEFPPEARAKADSVDNLATKEAWRGSSFENATNIIGALAFMVVLLFFLEGFCKLVVGEDRIRKDLERTRMVGLAAVLRWLNANSQIDPGKLRTVEFLSSYRNAWHSFGFYGGKPIACKGIELRSGERLPVIQPQQRLELLADLFDVFLAIDDLRAQQ